MRLTAAYGAVNTGTETLGRLFDKESAGVRRASQRSRVQRGAVRTLVLLGRATGGGVVVIGDIGG